MVIKSTVTANLVHLRNYVYNSQVIKCCESLSFARSVFFQDESQIFSNHLTFIIFCFAGYVLLSVDSDMFIRSYRSGVHNRVAIASRITFIFMNYGRQSVQDFNFFAMLLFYFHTLTLPCLHTSIWSFSIKYPSTADKRFHQCTAAITYILNCMFTAAYRFIKGRMRFANQVKLVQFMWKTVYMKIALLFYAW